MNFKTLENMKGYCIYDRFMELWLQTLPDANQ